MKRELRKLDCPSCGKHFETKNRTQQYCSFTCARAKGNGIKAKTVSKVCPVCGETFEAYARDRRVKQGLTMYCSRECYLESKKKGEIKSCPVCGKEFYTTRHACCSVECRGKLKSMNYEHKSYKENGYECVFINGYNKKGNAKKHRLVMEQFLGRRLSENEVVHHINGDRTDNRIENLEVMSRGEHSRLHRLQEMSEGKLPFGLKGDIK